MNKREEKQREFANVWLDKKFSVLRISPRFGKTKLAIEIFKKLGNPSILVIHPLDAIKKSWSDEFIKWNYDTSKVKYSTTQSLNKINEVFDIIVMDESHLYSERQLQELNRLIKLGNIQVLGLSGTISPETEWEIFQATGLEISCSYDMETAIAEKVITDYQIYIVMTELDNKIRYIKPNHKSKFLVTEQDRYDFLTKLIEIKQQEGEDLGMLPLMRMQIFKNSIAKLNTTKSLLDRYRGQRLLVFTGLTSVADSLGIPVYHSKNRDEDIKESFCIGKINELATVDMFEAGITIKPISKCILNSFDSNPETLCQRINRVMGFESDSPNKKSVIFIVATSTDVEQKWLAKGLSMFNQSKIKYVKL